MKKLYKRVYYKSKNEWLKAKEKTIGGSETAAIFNVSRWLTPNDIYNKIVLGKTKEIKENERMAEGTLAESHIRALFALDCKGFAVKNPPVKSYWFFYRKDKPYLSCTPDGLMINKRTSKIWGLEIKDVEIRTRDDKSAWESNTLPDQYLYQLFQYFVVLNDLEGVVLNAHLKYYSHNEETDSWEFSYAIDKPYYLYRDEIENVHDFVEKKETDFYENNILKHKRPKVVIKI